MSRAGVEGTLVLAAVPDRLQPMLDLTGISPLLPAHPTAAQALVGHTPSQNRATA
ncbi:hypothetical protein [Streptomyces sp. CB00455]|uniref:hypothetical protein n=1 Tax=Streptomyces sp. CB00455 TaxID=1703927 RepID=UPI000A8EF042|nr:hypothetical protein [Streptomyces sp. CB00455]